MRNNDMRKQLLTIMDIMYKLEVRLGEPSYIYIYGLTRIVWATHVGGGNTGMIDSCTKASK